MQALNPKAPYPSRRPWLTVLDKMIAQDLLRTLAAVLAVIVVIIVSRKFIRILDDAISGQIASDTLLSILGLKTVLTAIEFLPVAVFMAVLMVLGRMYRDQEMAAIASAGGGAGALYRAVFLLVAPLALMAMGLALYAAPWAEAKVDALMKYDAESADLRGISAGKFSEYSQGDLVFYVESISADNTMHQVFVQSRKPGTIGVINAQSARIKDLPDGRYVVFAQGERIQGKPGRLDYVLEKFDQYAVRVDGKAAETRFNKQALSVGKLWGAADFGYQAELQRRFAIPLGLLLLAFIAVPLARIAPRGGVYGNMLAGFLIYFSYGNLLRIVQSGVGNGTVSAGLATASLNGLLLLIGAYLLAKSYGWQWLKLKLQGKVS